MKDLMDSLRREVGSGFRSLRKSPGFTLVAVLTLTLGIGANTAIFTVVKSVLLEPLPYPQSDRLALVMEENLESGFPEFTVSPPNFRDFHDQTSSFESMAAFSGTSLALTGTGSPARLRARQVTGEYFQVLGVSPYLGRFIGPDDDRPDAEKVAVLGHGFWHSRFAADPSIIGQTLVLDGEVTTVIGIMPAHIPGSVELFVPLALDYNPDRRGSHWLAIFARLAPDVTFAQAEEELRLVAAGLAETYPESNTGWSAHVDPLHERVVEGVESALLILLLAVGLVLLIACVNVANLMLSRMALRQRDIAVRAALGADRWQLMRPLLVESTILSLAGGVLGFALAIRGTSALVALASDNLPRSESITVDAGVLLFSLVLSLAVGTLFGLLPAFKATRPDLQVVLRDSSRSVTSGGGQRLRTTLVLTEVAVALVLLVGAGLLIRSFTALVSVDPGFAVEDAVTVRLSLPEGRYKDDEAKFALYRQLFDRLQTVPGVERAAGIVPMPLTRGGFILQFFIDGRPRPPLNQEPQSNIRAASFGYFETMNIPLLKGRAFSANDNAETEPVAIINQSAARKFWPDQDPLAERITFGDPEDSDETTWWRVIGIVADIHHESLATDTEAEIFVPILQFPMDSITLVLRTAVASATVVESIRSELAAIDPDLPLYSIRTLEQIIDDSVAQPRFNSLLLGLFAGLAMLLAVIGVYGLISYSVAQRLREIGVRIALGASRGEIMQLVLRQGLTPVLAGALFGLGLALAGARLFTSLVYHVSPTDPPTYAAVTALLVMTSAVACVVPAMRATRVDPIVVLRQE